MSTRTLPPFGAARRLGSASRRKESLSRRYSGVRTDHEADQNLIGVQGAASPVVPAGLPPAEERVPAQAAPRFGTEPNVRVNPGDMVVMSATASSRLWLGGLIETVQRLGQVVQELERMNSLATGVPPASLAPLVDKLAEAAQGVGTRFAALSPDGLNEDSSALGPPATRSGARPAAGADMAGGQAYGPSVRSPVIPREAVPTLLGTAKVPVEALGAALGRAVPGGHDLSSATSPATEPGAGIPKALLPQIPVETPGALGRVEPGGYDSSSTARPSAPAVASSEQPMPRDSRWPTASDVAPHALRLADIDTAAALAGRTARVLLQHASNTLVTARLQAEHVSSPEPTGVGASIALESQTLATALTYAEAQVAMAVLQLAGFRNPSAGIDDARAGRSEAAPGSGIAGRSRNDAPYVLLQMRRALAVVLMCAAGVAVWVAATLDSSLARTVCAVALGVLGLASSARLLHRSTRLRISIARPDS